MAHKEDIVVVGTLATGFGLFVLYALGALGVPVVLIWAVYRLVTHLTGGAA